MKKLEVSFAGVKFKNPIIAASTDITREIKIFEKFAKSGIGGIVTKSVTDEAALKKIKITLMEIIDMNQKKIVGKIPDNYYFFSRGGPMIAMEDYIEKAKHQLKIAEKNDVILIGSISASKIEKWVEYAKIFEELGFPMIELNFGNPHGEAAKEKLGFLIGQSSELCVEILRKILENVNIPVIVKLTPQVTDMVSLAKELKDAGANGVTVMHRYQGLVVDENIEKPILGGWAGIGGPWMKPISLSNISKIYKNVQIDISGSNGIDDEKDVLDFIACGCSTVQIGSTLMLRGYEYLPVLLDKIEKLMDKKSIKNIKELKGRVADSIINYKNLGNIHGRKAEFDIDKCVKCIHKNCIDKCYFGALKEIDGKLFYKEELCSGCGICYNMCDYGSVKIKNT